MNGKYLKTRSPTTLPSISLLNKSLIASIPLKNMITYLSCGWKFHENSQRTTITQLHIASVLEKSAQICGYILSMRVHRISQHLGIDVIHLHPQFPIRVLMQNVKYSRNDLWLLWLTGGRRWLANEQLPRNWVRETKQ